MPNGFRACGTREQEHVSWPGLIGNLGDWKGLSGVGGLAELRDSYGPGYRVYFSFIGQSVILLLAGSTKRDQKKMVQRAGAYLEDYKNRMKL